MNEPMILLLRTVHILAGLFWVGATLTVGLFVFPGAMAAGPSGMQVVQQIMLRRKLVVYLPVSAVLTMLAGIALYWRAMSVSGGAWRLSPMGTGMTVGAAAAILAAIIGMGVASPAGRKLATLGPPGSGANEAERARLGRRATLGSRASMTLLIVATIAMAVARYL